MAPSSPESIVTVDGHRLRLTNLDKVLYPGTGTTKADVVGYYSDIAAVMLPHCSGRPATRKRWVNGVGTPDEPGQVFFSKNLDAGTPDWVVRADIEHSDGPKTYPLVNNRATLAWMAQIAALEIHVPQWRFTSTGRPRNPDRIVLDLDPGPGVALRDVAEIAVLTRDILTGMGLHPVPVTSGSKGIHLYAALDGSYTSDQVSALAKELARSLEADHPDRVVSDMKKSKRDGRVLIDWSQNNASKTTVAPYSLRGRDEPFVAAPRTWRELTHPGLRQLRYPEVLERVRRRGDPMAELEDEARASDTWHVDDDDPAADPAARDRLSVYRSKRDPSRTPEPVPAAHGPASEELTFVIQEHHARRLHWDLRLSHEGVLVSWALPKGVPLDRKRNHLAVQTEDHPMEYATFHGTIPAGEYGAGQMTIWDSGTYELQKWREGKEVIVTLTGRPDGGLAGADGPGRTSRFALIHTGGRSGEENHWLIHLMEGADSPPPARTTALSARRQRSSSTDRAPAVARPSTPPRRRPSPAAGTTPSDRPTTAPPAGATRPARGDRPPSGPHGPPPEPMLATSGDDVRIDDDHGWAFEMKWDGVRTIAVVDDGHVQLLSRSGRDTTAQYPELGDLGERVHARRAVLDGEIVAIDAQGRPSFSLLQPRMQSTRTHEIAEAARRNPVRLMLFDVLEVDGRSLLELSYEERREVLGDLVESSPGSLVQVPPAFEGDLEHAMAASRGWDLEGVIAKRRDSRYVPGRRSRAWLKLKHSRTQEVVVVGWRPGQGGRTGRVGALLLAVPDGDTLVYVGRVGSGLSEQETKDMVTRFAATEIAGAPVSGVPALDARGAHWVAPTSVAEVEFGEWTPGGRLRHPRWRGWRPDKSPDEVVRE